MDTASTQASTRACNGCGEVKPRTLEFFRSEARRSDGLSSKCRRCDSEKAKAWYASNRDRAIANGRAWKDRNPERCRTYYALNKAGLSAKDGYVVEDRATVRAALRRKERRREKTPRGVQIRYQRELVRDLLAGKAKSARLIGCTATTLRRHLERQFLPGMTWENRSQWHIDHIRPLASFDLEDVAQRADACNYLNLRPVWPEENVRKGATREHLI